MTALIRTDSGNHDFVELVHLLDADLRERDGEEHAFYAQFNKIDKIRNVVVAYQDQLAVGCGAFKAYAEGIAEVKRMYVRPTHRGQGIAGIVLQELEVWAAELGFHTVLLETGKKQYEAIRLYTKSGYRLIPNYGQYKEVENSICMQKSITGIPGEAIPVLST
ncbi:GNAT family N-acetyltransferase [Pontibacter chitinilyticus]|uniref:GNAT family N-acetyltransferase n=1 Tax=Pontibacter chitinilyticus TaxID=2674989 RepID=UPI00321965D3